MALVALAALVSQREHASQFDRLTGAQAQRVEDAIDGLQKSLTTLENMSRYAVALYDPPDPFNPEVLTDFSARLLPLVPQVYSMVWAPAVRPADLPQALARIGRTEPVTPPPSQPVAELGGDEPRFLNFDIHPRTEANLRSRGLVLNGLALPAKAIGEAVTLRSVRATAPVRLVQLPEAPALVAYGPIHAADGRLVGVLGFSYRFDRLFDVVQVPGLAVRAVDRDAPEQGPVFAAGAIEPSRSVRREVEFAGRAYAVEANLLDDPAGQAMWNAMLVFGLGLLGAIAVGGVAWRLALVNQELERNLSARLAAEEQLQVVLRELSHRIGNLLTLVQSVARQTFTPGADMKERLSLFEGRLTALAHSGRMAATANDGATLRAMAGDILDGFGDRFTVDGPDLPLGPIGAQFLALAIHELATNAAKHGALADPSGKVELSWRVESGAFQMVWRESGRPIAAPPASPGKGFGSRLLGQLVPAQLAGAAERTFEPSGFSYRLSAPADSLGR